MIQTTGIENLLGLNIIGDTVNIGVSAVGSSEEPDFETVLSSFLTENNVVLSDKNLRTVEENGFSIEGFTDMSTMTEVTGNTNDKTILNSISLLSDIQNKNLNNDGKIPVILNLKTTDGSTIKVLAIIRVNKEANADTKNISLDIFSADNISLDSDALKESILNCLKDLSGSGSDSSELSDLMSIDLSDSIPLDTEEDNDLETALVSFVLNIEKKDEQTQNIPLKVVFKNNDEENILYDSLNAVSPLKNDFSSNTVKETLPEEINYKAITTDNSEYTENDYHVVKINENNSQTVPSVLLSKNFLIPEIRTSDKPTIINKISPQSDTKVEVNSTVNEELSKDIRTSTAQNDATDAKNNYNGTKEKSLKTAEIAAGITLQGDWETVDDGGKSFLSNYSSDNKSENIIISPKTIISRENVKVSVTNDTIKNADSSDQILSFVNNESETVKNDVINNDSYKKENLINKQNTPAIIQVTTSKKDLPENNKVIINEGTSANPITDDLPQITTIASENQPIVEKTIDSSLRKVHGKNISKEIAQKLVVINVENETVSDPVIYENQASETTFSDYKKSVISESLTKPVFSGKIKIESTNIEPDENFTGSISKMTTEESIITAEEAITETVTDNKVSASKLIVSDKKIVIETIPALSSEDVLFADSDGSENEISFKQNTVNKESVEIPLKSSILKGEKINISSLRSVVNVYVADSEKEIHTTVPVEDETNRPANSTIQSVSSADSEVKYDANSLVSSTEELKTSVVNIPEIAEETNPVTDNTTDNIITKNNINNNIKTIILTESLAEPLTATDNENTVSIILEKSENKNEGIIQKNNVVDIPNDDKTIDIPIENNNNISSYNLNRVRKNWKEIDTILNESSYDARITDPIDNNNPVNKENRISDSIYVSSDERVEKINSETSDNTGKPIFIVKEKYYTENASINNDSLPESTINEDVYEGKIIVSEKNTGSDIKPVNSNKTIVIEKNNTNSEISGSLINDPSDNSDNVFTKEISKTEKTNNLEINSLKDKNENKVVDGSAANYSEKEKSVENKQNADSEKFLNIDLRETELTKEPESAIPAKEKVEKEIVFNIDTENNIENEKAEIIQTKGSENNVKNPISGKKVIADIKKKEESVQFISERNIIEENNLTDKKSESSAKLNNVKSENNTDNIAKSSIKNEMASGKIYITNDVDKANDETKEKTKINNMSFNTGTTEITGVETGAYESSDNQDFIKKPVVTIENEVKHSHKNKETVDFKINTTYMTDKASPSLTVSERSGYEGENVSLNSEVITQSVLNNKGKTSNNSDAGFSGIIQDKTNSDIKLAETRVFSDRTYISPETEKSILENIVKSAKVMISKSQSSATIKIEPPSLGTLKLEIVTEKSKVTGKIIVESQEVKEIIQNNLSDLKQSLSQNGLKVESFDVQVGHNGGTDSWARRETLENERMLRNSINNTAYNVEKDDNFQQKEQQSRKRSYHSGNLDLWI